MGEHPPAKPAHGTVVIKQEPVDATPRTTPAKRDHLRALLERARGTRPSQEPPVRVKLEPVSPPRSAAEEPSTRIVNLSARSNRLEPPAFLPTPRVADKTPLLPKPTHPTSSGSTELLPQHAKQPQAGLLPTPVPDFSQDQVHPTIPNYSSVSPVTVPATLPSLNAEGGISTAPSGVLPAHVHASHVPHVGHVVTASTPTPTVPIVYTTAALGPHIHTCPCAHALPTIQTHVHAIPGHDVVQWHYQTHHPPTLVIPSHFHPPSVGDQALLSQTIQSHVDQLLTTSVSPSVSASTSSTDASSSNGKRPRGRSMGRDENAKHTVGIGDRKMARNVKLGVPISTDDYTDKELHSDFIHTVHILIPEDSVGCLIGHRGETMKEINAASDCTLSVRDPQSFPAVEYSRVLRLYGKPKGICNAQRLVIERIRQHRAQKNDLSYIHLDGETLAPLTKDFITREISDSIESTEDDCALDEDGQMKWLIHMDNVGRIMGSEGIILRAIARDTSTSIRVSSIKDMAPGSDERIVFITGESENIKEAVSIIESKAGGRPASSGVGGKGGRYFVIPHYAAGFLIGPQGSRIRKIREDTGARIQIPSQHDLPLGYVNRTLHVQGTRDQIDNACAAIRRRLQSFMVSEEAQLVAEDDEIVLQLILPTRICNFLLDQRGRLIREINDKAGAHARFLPPLDDEHRICVIYGEQSKVFRAERLILQFVASDAIANKKAGAGGVPPRKRSRAIERHSDVEYEDDGDESTGVQPRRDRKRRPTAESSGRVVVRVADSINRETRGSTARAIGRGRQQQSNNGRNRRRR